MEMKQRDRENDSLSFPTGVKFLIALRVQFEFDATLEDPDLTSFSVSPPIHASCYLPTWSV